MKKSMKKMVTMVLAGMMVLGVTGTTGTTVVQKVSAASGHSSVGGGIWDWSSIPGVRASSSYYHGQKTHSASAKVGTGRMVRDVESAGNTACATAYGIGTTYVYWSNNTSL